jgi:hypothetical protein
MRLKVIFGVQADWELVLSSKSGFRGIVRGQVRKLLVVGPFFDEGLRLLCELERFWIPGEIVVAVQPDTVSSAAERSSGRRPHTGVLAPAQMAARPGLVAQGRRSMRVQF